MIHMSKKGAIAYLDVWQLNYNGQKKKEVLCAQSLFIHNRKLLHIYEQEQEQNQECPQQLNTSYLPVHLRKLRTYSNYQDDNLIGDGSIIHPHVAVIVSWQIIHSIFIFCIMRN